jgi:hypothetical protein
MLGGEVFRSLAYEVDMGTFVEDQAGGLDGVAEAFDAGYTSGAEGGSVHEEGVELDAAFGGEEAAAAGIEGGVVFKDGDGGFYGVGGGGSLFEEGVAGGEGAGDALLVIFGHFGWDGPGAAVDQEGGADGWRVVQHEVTGYRIVTWEVSAELSGYVKKTAQM